MSPTYRYERAGNPMGIGGAMTAAVKAIIIANASVFAFEFLLQVAGQGWLDAIFQGLFALQPDLVYGRFYIWQLATYLFLHGSPMHILVNMFMLWMFGVEVERMWGTAKFAKYYLLTGVGAGILTCFFSPGSKTIGASGAVFGVILAYGLTFPDRVIMFWFFFPMKARHYVILMAAIEFYTSYEYVSDGIGHFAHLGGMLFGYLYLKRAWRLREWITELRWRARRRRFRVFESHQQEERPKEKDRYPYH